MENITFILIQIELFLKFILENSLKNIYSPVLKMFNETYLKFHSFEE